MKKKIDEEIRNGQKQYSGIVYVRTLLVPGDDYGKKYVGNTMSFEERNRKWNNKNTTNYAGEKLLKARTKYGVSTKAWGFCVLAYIYDTDREILQKRLDKEETDYIGKYDSYNNGFNSNTGGTGRKGVKVSKKEITQRNATRKKKGFHQTSAAKKKISNTLMHHVVTKETKEKIKQGNSGKHRTDAMRQKQSARMKGKEPKVATAGAKKWVKKNGGGYWKNRNLPEKTRKKLKAIQRAKAIKVRAHLKDGRTMDFETQLDAAKFYKINVGSVSYSVKHNSVCKKGEIRFEQIQRRR